MLWMSGQLRQQTLISKFKIYIIKTKVDICLFTDLHWGFSGTESGVAWPTVIRKKKGD